MQHRETENMEETLSNMKEGEDLTQPLESPRMKEQKGAVGVRMGALFAFRVRAFRGPSLRCRYQKSCESLFFPDQTKVNFIPV